MTKQLNRKALYDLVWSKPMSTIAKDYGLSDRGMAKLCERNSIPVPPRGYWAKKAAGHKVHKPPLVILDPQKPDTAILLSEAKPVTGTAAPAGKKEEPALPASIQEAIAREALPEHQIKVPATLHNPHSIVNSWIKDEERELEMNKRYGSFSHRSPPTPLERRRRRILSVLFKELEERGFKIQEENRNDYHGGLWITYERDKVSFEMYERIKQSRRELTEKEKEDRNQYYSSNQRWTQEKEPTGMLEITLYPGDYSYSKIKIQEDDARPFEERLNEVVVKIIEVMWSAKSQRLEKEEKERLEREAEHQRHLRRQAAEKEQQRRLNLEKKAFAWKRAQTIREYIAAVEEARGQGRLPAEEAEFKSWKEWAIKHANSIDFIAHGNPLISLSEDPEKLGGDEERSSSGGSYSSSSSWFPGKQWYHR